METHINASPFNLGEYLQRNWGWFLALGILLIALGALSLGFVITATILSVIAFGIILFSAGVIQVIEGIKTRKWSGFFLHLLIGLLYIASGAILFFSPGIGAVTLTLVLAVFYAAIGLFRIITSLSMQFRQWGWTFFSGIVSLLVGLFIWYSWPFSGLWIIGFYIGIDLLFYGLSILSFAISARQASRHV